MVSRSNLKGMARLALAAILFTQAALVFAACESARPTPALVIAFAEARIEGTSCHEQEMNVNLCLAHCLGEDQSLDKPLVKVPALSVAPLFFMPAVLVSPHEAHAPRRLAVPHAAGPPPRILFQSLLI
jgi:hypothetical protein